MDKETLGNYGWVVVVLIVLALMISLATPFGSVISSNIKGSTNKLMGVASDSLNNVTKYESFEGLNSDEAGGGSGGGMMPDDSPENDLEGKTLTVFGTSISAGAANGSTETTYCMVIAENNEMTLQNYAAAGHNITQTLSAYRTQKNNLSSLDKDDFVIFEGLLNSYSLTLGEVTPDGTTTFDTTTVIGVLESLMYEYKNSGCKAKMGFILTHFSTTAETDAEVMTKYNLYWDTAISVFEKYDVPYLDLRNEKFPLSDKVHPTEVGHQELAKLVEPWLKTL